MNPIEPAFVFPGQGSQYPGMGRELARCDAAALRLIPMAEEISGLPVTELLHRADAATIADPAIAQLLVFVSSSVLYTHLTGLGYRPSAVAGHSLGEYSALVACGGLEWTDALALVVARGRAMADAAADAPGAMAAVVGLPMPEVLRLCADTRADEVAVPANINSDRQVVVSGSPEVIDRVVATAKCRGALRAKRLPVGGAYHSPLMDEAETAFAARLLVAPLRPPRLPFVSSVTADWVADVAAYRAELLRQMTSPVRWRDTFRTMFDAGIRTFVEVGPGRTLTGLDREMNRDARHLTAQEALYSRAIIGEGAVRR
ncbi:ACP S-malonyltransferase [Nocardia arthritidis]|uniref:Malonyl CoA-acyl carrier protein transacylase n=1 Tax=Nocardia arthritidis TaxID=228602 RepID=A0A6G9YED4_9NOCA|nr:ACP S-malonyltransferase [Nocardia arthritidis]QIS11591.1 acyltransferase domain-containing protein [Nocardia arthritidis]